MKPDVKVALALVLAVAPAYAGDVPGSGCPLFPADNVWHADIRTLPVHARSSQWVGAMNGATAKLHPDFGPSGGAAPYGIPYQVVDGTHQKVSVSFTYADESDPGPYPLGPDTPIEGGADALGDRHALVVDKDTCRLHETWDTHYVAGGSHAGSGAIFDLRSNALRPDGWTSADAAGLPVLAGLLLRSEVLAGEVDHAIRVTAQTTDRSYLWPARHQAGAVTNPAFPPMGARFRLKTSYDVTHFRTDTQVVLRAFQRHGMILADNGSNWFFQGEASDAWPEAMLDELKQVPAGQFEAVDESSLMVSPDSGQARTPGPSPSPSPSGFWRHWVPPVVVRPTPGVPARPPRSVRPGAPRPDRPRRYR
jgi:hypothetical protein